MQGVDNIGRSIIIDAVHHKVHDGEIFTVNGRMTLTSGLIKDMYIITGARELHFSGLIKSESDLYIDLVEAPVYTTTSFTISTLTAYNFKRESAKTLLTQFWSVNTATATGGSTIKASMVITGNLGNSNFGGEARQQIEWELAPNTSYLLRMTEKSSANNLVNYDYECYEE